MLRIIAILFGIGFIFVGVAGFLPMFMPNGLLLGLFEVDAMHNLLHIVSGVIAIMAATSYKYSRYYFQVFGIIYAIIAIVSIVTNGDMSWLTTHFNLADNLLYIVIAVIALYLGFSAKKRNV